MLPLFDRKAASNESEFPATRYLCWLLASDRSRADAGKRARELGLRLDYARFYFENIRRR